jgi:hypothetical protein
MGSNPSFPVAGSVVCDVLAVHLRHAGRTNFIRMALPREEGRWAVIRARTSLLVPKLKSTWSARFPDEAKLKRVIGLIRNGQPLTVPVLTLSSARANPANFVFVSGQHRVAVLHGLGAEEIPVAVPWECADTLLSFLGAGALT